MIDTAGLHDCWVPITRYSQVVPATKDYLFMGDRVTENCGETGSSSESQLLRLFKTSMWHLEAVEESPKFLSWNS